MDEKEVLNKINSMCEESLSPIQFEYWETIKSELVKNRERL